MDEEDYEEFLLIDAENEAMKKDNIILEDTIAKYDIYSECLKDITREDAKRIAALEESQLIFGIFTLLGIVGTLGGIFVW